MMPAWAAASVLYFLYISVVALGLPGLSRQARIRACGGAATGLLLCVVSGQVSAFWLQLVVLPPVTLLIAYWCSGLLWTGPIERIEGFFLRTDVALGVPRIAARLPAVGGAVLELAYIGVYPLIPIALVLHLAYAPEADADRFWTVVLVTDFICFGMLPWVQTRPPRLLEAYAPWRSRLRSFNVKLLSEASIGVNTVPSGHAAEALAAALLVSGAPWPIAVSMWLAAIGVSAGAVLGRYHFAVDAIAGWVVALAVWMAI